MNNNMGPSDLSLRIASFAADRCTTEAIFGLDESGSIVYANRMAIHMYGLAGDFVGRKLSDWASDDCLVSDWPKVMDRLNGRGEFFIEEEHHRPDGSAYPVQIGCRLMKDGDRAFVIMSAKDLTERKGLQESLNVARERAEQYFEIADLIFAVVSPEGELMDLNQNGCRLLGQDKSAVIGRSAIDILSGLGHQGAAGQALRRLVEEGHETAVFDTDLTFLDGRQASISWRLGILRDDAGKPLAILAAGVDLTDKKRSEEIIRKQNEISQSLVSLSTELVAGANFDEMAKKILGSTCRIVGCDRGVLGQVDEANSLLNYTHEWRSDGGGNNAAPLLKRLPLDQLGFSGQFAKSGKTMVINSPADLPEGSLERKLLEGSGMKSLVMVPLPVGNPPIGVLSFGREQIEGSWTSEQISACELVAGLLANAILRNRERVAAEEQVKELDDLKNTFIQVVSHQVRTPLNSIRWSLETLLSEEIGSLTDSQKDFLRVVYHAETEILSRLDEMLTALDIEEGRLVFRKSRFALDGLWASVSAQLKRDCKVKNIELVEEVGEGPLDVEIDSERIRKALEVLATNAADYTKSEGKISVRLERRGERIRFEISDTGVGIPETEQKRVFERFYRASNASIMKPDATGLGLSIAKYYVEQHGGEMRFASNEGEGTTFWFELPAV